MVVTQQHEAKRRGHAPVDHFVDMIGNHVADHLVARAADQRRRDVIAKRQNENEHEPRTDSGHGLRQVNPQEGHALVRPQRLRGAHMAFGDRFHHAVERKDHVGQKHMRHRHQGAEAVEDQFQRLLDDARQLQQAVQRPIALQDDDPGRRPHQKRCPERQQDGNHQQPGHEGRKPGQHIGRRIAEQQANDGNRQADFKGSQEQGDVKTLFRRLADDLAIAVLFQIAGRQNEAGGERARLEFEDGPAVQVEPALVDFNQGILPGWRLRFRQAVCCFHQQAAEPFLEIIEVAGDDRQFV